MASERQIAANRANAQHSTGPTTEVGKAAAARNAVMHGAFARIPVLPGESAEEWEAHRSGILDALAPVGLLEVTLAERVALLLWRLGRLARFEPVIRPAGGPGLALYLPRVA
jgi:hypothetical protein